MSNNTFTEIELKKGEFAVLLDDIINPFLNINVDFLGNLIPNDND